MNFGRLIITVVYRLDLWSVVIYKINNHCTRGQKPYCINNYIKLLV